VRFADNNASSLIDRITVDARQLIRDMGAWIVEKQAEL
jgi:hypothetical protein